MAKIIVSGRLQNVASGAMYSMLRGKAAFLQVEQVEQVEENVDEIGKLSCVLNCYYWVSG